MDTQTISMLLQLAQRQNVMQSHSSQDDKDSTSFEDMLSQKRDNVSGQKETTSSSSASKENTATQEKTETPEAPVQEEDMTNAQQLLAAMALQQQAYTPQVLAVQQQNVNVAEVQTPAAQAAVQATAAQTVAETPVTNQTIAQTQTAPVADPETPSLTMVQPQANATATQAEPQQMPLQAQTAPTEQQTTESTNLSSQVEVEAPQEQNTGKNEEPTVIVNSNEQPLFQDVESVPVKVGETMQTVDTTSPDMDSQLADTIQAELKTVGDKVQVQLKPEHLGQITIELTQHGEKLGVVIYAENSKTVSLLAQHAGSLGVLMEDRTGQHVNIQVQQQEQQQPQYDGHNQQQQSQQEEHQQPRRKEEQDSFINQLRLGLFQFETV
ncbi:MAG: flagellar hook-length control protein FliK [Butyricicoccus sp.]|nr:flagellar hook-length control protein FliK [Butyricicoccus sp.]